MILLATLTDCGLVLLCDSIVYAVDWSAYHRLLKYRGGTQYELSSLMYNVTEFYNNSSY